MSKSSQSVKQKRGCVKNDAVKNCKMCEICGREKENEKYMSEGSLKYKNYNK